MRIAMVHQPWNAAVPPVDKGSIAIWTYEVCNRLALDHDVTVYARTVKGLPAVQRFRDVRYKRLSVRPNPFSDYLGRGIEAILGNKDLPQFAQPTFYAAYRERVAKSIAEDEYDVVHLHNMLTFPAAFKSRRPKTRVVLHMHCEWLSQIPRLTALGLLEGVDRIIACSQYVADTVNRHLQNETKICAVIRNGVDTDLFSANTKSSDERRSRNEILFVGRITPEKGLHILIQAFKDVQRLVPDATLRIVGPYAATRREFIVDVSTNSAVRALDRFYERDYLATLREMADPLLNNSIIFEGNVRYRELPAFYRAAKVLANPSLSDSFPMTLIEAQACGLPVVCSTAGGMPEIVEDGKTGLLVEPDNHEALVKALVELLSDKARAAIISHKAREVAENRFSWSNIAGQTAKVYRELLGYEADGREIGN